MMSLFKNVFFFLVRKERGLSSHAFDKQSVSNAVHVYESKPVPKSLHSNFVTSCFSYQSELNCFCVSDCLFNFQAKQVKFGKADQSENKWKTSPPGMLPKTMFYDQRGIAKPQNKAHNLHSSAYFFGIYLITYNSSQKLDVFVVVS